MSASLAAAYGRSRTPKQMEAEVFARAARALRAAPAAEAGLAHARAMADMRRLWDAVLTSVLDRENRLPPPLRAQIAGVARAAIRECDAERPDAAFLLEVTDEVGAGLWA